MTSIITLTTDFGPGGPFVAAMKGVILGINPSVRLVDVSHTIAPQNVREGAAMMAEATPWFPPRTIHVGVVDPGVGTARRMIYARIGDQQYLAPDNGLLSLLGKRRKVSRVIELANADLWLPQVSDTFHGRDIFAPIAAQLSLGVEPEQLGPIVRDMVRLDWPDATRTARQINGMVLWIDHFGNLISNIPANVLAEARQAAQVQVRCCGATISGIGRTYSDYPPGETLALVGSSGHLEIAVAGGSAARKLSAQVGAPVVVDW